MTATSPLAWVGGKAASAKRIVAAFPPPQAYGTYCEVFGGAAHVLSQKARSKHLETFNDLNDDRINFWMMARDKASALQDRIDSLPLAGHSTPPIEPACGHTMDDLERAARWFYVMRSSFGSVPDRSRGWGYSTESNLPPGRLTLSLRPD